MKLILEKRKLATAPAILVHQEDRDKAVEQGCILFYHGLTVNKEINLKELTSLAEQGFLAIGIDNIGHGERRYPDFEERFSPDNPNVESEFLNAVQVTAKETPAIVDCLEQENLYRPKKLGIAGVSMGGFITYSALLAESRFTAAATVVASPQWKLDLPESPYKHPEKFFPVALLSQTAGKDLIVPNQFAKTFHEKLEPYYQSAPERQNYIDYPDSDHMMEPQDWEICWKTLIQWFQRFLKE